MEWGKALPPPMFTLAASTEKAPYANEHINNATMKKTLITVAALFAMSGMQAVAQNKRQSRAAAKAEAEKEAMMLEQRMTQMAAATQKVIFIDSFVVDKDAFLDKYNLSNDAGSLHSYDSFFKTQKQPNAYVYLNGLGDKCYFSSEDSVGEFSIYTSDNFNGQWTRPTLLGGIEQENGYESVNYPFMMADGTTFYFSATGKESIGGYDIFVTRYDTESGSFLKAENIGMPFNSTANDYMYAVDEFNNIGWFATDRNQTEGKVCVYVFIPSESRQLYSPDEYSEEQIRSLARLDRIADTWGDGKARQAALNRLQAMQHERLERNAKSRMAFIVNDKTTYTRMSDFRSKGNAEKYKRLQELESKKSAVSIALEKARNFYATANGGERSTLKNEILQSERSLEAMEMQIRQLSKEIRNSEIKLLK